MITETRKNTSEISERTRKEYYLLLDNGEPVGVCTNHKFAESCLELYACEKRAAKMVGFNLYAYEDGSEIHTITIKPVKKLKTAR